MRDYIDIKKGLMPYSITSPLGKDIFTLRFEYNAIADLFTVALSKAGTVITEAEPVVYGIPLFQDIYQAGRFPALHVMPYDESGTFDTVTWENFGGEVRLTIDRGE